MLGNHTNLIFIFTFFCGLGYFLHIMIRYQVFLPSTNYLHTVRWYQVFLSIFINPSTRAEYDTRSISKRSLAGLNSELSFQELLEDPIEVLLCECVNDLHHSLFHLLNYVITTASKFRE